MYLKNIAIKNIGPINELVAEMPFDNNGNPKPIIFVGENGSGKTILQAQIVDSFYEIADSLFSNVLKHDGLRKIFFKLSGGGNLQTGKDKGFSALTFIDNEKNKIEYFDKIGNIKQEDINSLLIGFALSPNGKNDNQKGVTIFDEAQKQILTNEWLSGAYFYQPAYRYEEPFWKNDPFLDHQRFKNDKKFSNQLDKGIEIIVATKDNKSYLMDLVLDWSVDQGNSTDRFTWSAINNILRKIKQKSDISFGIGPRGGYRVAIGIRDDKGGWKKTLLPSIDNLSLGESLLLNLFINIIRHGDRPPKLAEQIQGIVAIDEIDVHLHTDLQNSVLPELIKLFPKIQFILTTHSPLFLLGMEKTFGKEGIEIRNMPNGEVITTERFSEFGKAYKVLKNTEKFEEDLKNKITENKKPKIYVEGPTDIQYIKKAFELYGKQESLKKIDIEIIGEETPSGTKESNNNALKSAGVFIKTKLDLFSQKIILLHDPEEKVEEASLKEKLYIRRMPKNDINPLQRGIEDLFSDIIQKLRTQNPSWFECHMLGTEEKNLKIADGKKQAICAWICCNGTKADFGNFATILEIIENILIAK